MVPLLISQASSPLHELVPMLPVLLSHGVLPVEQEPLPMLAMG